MKCKICGVRKARRFCPGVNGDICSICCGTERENTVRCPFSCVYLQEARLHERSEPLDMANAPNKDVVIRESFIGAHGQEISKCCALLLRAAFSEPGTVDNDIRETLEALIRTYRTLQSGLYYDSRPENVIAARVFDRFQQGVPELRSELKSADRLLSDSDMLTILVFLQRVELDRNNGRRLGRAFLDSLRKVVEDMKPHEEQAISPLIHTV